VLPPSGHDILVFSIYLLRRSAGTRTNGFGWKVDEVIGAPDHTSPQQPERFVLPI
jgi:hypothetical protein